MSGAQWMPPQSVVTEEWLETELQADVADDVAADERTVFDRLAGGAGRPLLLFGAGNLGRRVLAGLRRVGADPFAFIDNAEPRQGTIVDGLPVLSPTESKARHGDQAVVVVTIWTPRGCLAYPGVAKQMQALGVNTTVPFVPLFWKYPDEFLPYFCLDAPHHLYADAESVKGSFRLVDPDSRHEYLTQISYLLSAMDSIEIAAPTVETYFPPDLIELSPDEVFVDCGAYDGDTLASFMQASGGRFRQVVAIEPDPLAAARLREVRERLPREARERVVIHQRAVGVTTGWVEFESGGTPGSRVSDSGDVSVECTALDELVGHLAPTFIKMDIEGAEEAALTGAAQTIREHRPILAICLYHLQTDIYRLPRLILQLCPDYRLHLRRQGPISEDLVCFAIPNERLANHFTGTTP